MTSFSAQSSPRIQSRLSRSPTPSVSSNDSWDMSIQKLTTSLTQICRSPVTSCNDLPGLPDETSIRKPPRRPNRFSLDETANRARLYVEVVSTQACFIRSVGRMCKKVRIRHEQSVRKLDEQLASICRASHDTLSALQEESKAASDKPQRPVIRRESVKRGLKFNVDTNDMKVHHLCVSMTPKSVDVLELTQQNERRTVHSEPILDETIVDVEKTMCLLSEGVLNIKQYPKQYLTWQYSQGSTCYLPIMQEDYDSATWHMALFIPKSYETKTSRVVVKTVDEKLVVRWSSGNGVCQLTMDLPHNVQTRSVNGVISEDNQLILEAKLCTSRDRCSTF